jgi:hypothetical protein
MAMTLAQVEAEVVKLRRDVGNFDVKQDTSVRPAELPNGDYNVAFRQRQLGEATDAAVALVNEFRDRLAALEAGSGSATAPTSNRFTGDVEVHGRLFVGPDIDKGRAAIDMPYAIQMMGASAIAGVSNLDNAQVQGAGAHVGVAAVPDGDAGVRMLKNCGQTRDPDGVYRFKQHIDGTLPSMAFGPDRQGDFSISRVNPGEAHENCQDIVLRIDPDTKQVAWVSMRPGWSLGLWASQTLKDFARRWNIPV